MAKVIGTVEQCYHCPNCAYNSGGRYVCTKSHQKTIHDTKAIPIWCPLPDAVGIVPSGVKVAQPAVLLEALSELEWCHKEYGAVHGTETIEALRAYLVGVTAVCQTQQSPREAGSVAHHLPQVSASSWVPPVRHSAIPVEASPNCTAGTAGAPASELPGVAYGTQALGRGFFNAEPARCTNCGGTWSQHDGKGRCPSGVMASESAPRYYCNKCGSFPDAVRHNRPDGTQCPYIARVASGVKTCDGGQHD